MNPSWDMLQGQNMKVTSKVHTRQSAQLADKQALVLKISAFGVDVGHVECILWLSSWWLNQPIWKICSSNWISSPSRGEKKQYLKPPPSFDLCLKPNIMLRLSSYIDAPPPRYFC